MAATLATNEDCVPNRGVEKQLEDEVRPTSPSETDIDGGSQKAQNPGIERKSAGALVLPESSDGSKDKDNDAEKGAVQDEDDEGRDYVTGWKLFVLMAAITIATFLMLLDMSIIVTVRM